MMFGFITTKVAGWCKKFFFVFNYLYLMMLKLWSSLNTQMKCSMLNEEGIKI
jgi:hypothetical protein